MARELSARVSLVDGLHFVGSDRLGYTVHLDATAAEGGGSAPTPMELLLISLAGCSAMDVVAILRKKRQLVEHLEVRAHGQRRDEHPTIFIAIDLEYIIHGSGIDPVAVRRAIELSRDRYCPIWAMLRANVPIRSSPHGSSTRTWMIHDSIVIGAGVAGLAAAACTLHHHLRTRALPPDLCRQSLKPLRTMQLGWPAHGPFPESTSPRHRSAPPTSTAGASIARSAIHT